jgi:hypothetical protein
MTTCTACDDPDCYTRTTDRPPAPPPRLGRKRCTTCGYLMDILTTTTTTHPCCTP